MDDIAPDESISLFSAVSSRNRINGNGKETTSFTDVPDSSKSKPSKGTNIEFGNRPPSNESAKTSNAETLKKITGIESAKDRAQITSSSAMSIVHVALLKSVLDYGSENDKLYGVRVGFIMAALVLQVFAGFLALYIALLRSYFTKYRNDFLNDCLKMCCPFKCRRRTNKKKKRMEMTGNSAVLGEKQGPKVYEGCCPFECTAQSYYKFEYEILDLYEGITENVIKTDIETASSVGEIGWCTKNIAELRDELDGQGSDDLSDATDRETTQKEIERMMKKREELEKNQLAAERFLAQGIAMEKHVQKIHEQHVLKRVTFWQNLLNMIFYIVFILNAIITGLGLADPHGQVAGENGVAGVGGATTLGEATTVGGATMAVEATTA